MKGEGEPGQMLDDGRHELSVYYIHTLFRTEPSKRWVGKYLGPTKH